MPQTTTRRTTRDEDQALAGPAVAPRLSVHSAEPASAPNRSALPIRDVVAALKAAAEPTRLRILALLAGGALNVKDLTTILGQSQPRISRHLRLLTEAGLVERAPEGSWVYFHLAEDAGARALATSLVDLIAATDSTRRRDAERASAAKRDRESRAQAYFAEHASDWDEIRKLHVPEAELEAALVQAFGFARADARPADLLVDLGTGTGRMLELFAPNYARGLGIDLNAAMLAYARARLAKAGLSHAQVRQGDVYALPVADHAAQAVVIHQILHFLSVPERAVAEAARILAPGGRIVIADFAPHGLEFLRESQAHERLGFADSAVSQWLTDAGLVVDRVTHLPPDTSVTTPGLTVSLWAAHRPV